MLPLRFVAGFQPLGQKATVIVDMLTNEDVRLAEIHQEMITNNINNIAKLTLVTSVESGGLMAVCFLVAAVGLVLGLCMIPVFWSLLALLVLGLIRCKRKPRCPVVLDVQPLPSVRHSPPKTSRSFFFVTSWLPDIFLGRYCLFRHSQPFWCFRSTIRVSYF